MKRIIQITKTATLLFFLIPVSAQTPVAIETELLGHLADISKFGNYGGETNDEKLSAANAGLEQKLKIYGTRLDVLKYGFPKLKDEMYVATSKDGKLRIYSWDMQTGGTMHDFASVFQFQGKSGKVFTWTDEDEDESAGSFYTQIFQVASKSGPVYLVNSNFIGSTSLHGQSIKTLRIDGDVLDRDAKLIKTGNGLQDSVSFGYDFFSVVDRPERPIKLFTFDEARKEFKFPVVIEDEKKPQGRVTNKLITYRFNGTHFVKIN